MTTNRPKFNTIKIFNNSPYNTASRIYAENHVNSSRKQKNMEKDTGMENRARKLSNSGTDFTWFGEISSAVQKANRLTRAI